MNAVIEPETDQRTEEKAAKKAAIFGALQAPPDGLNPDQEFHWRKALIERASLMESGPLASPGKRPKEIAASVRKGTRGELRAMVEAGHYHSQHVLGGQHGLAIRRLDKLLSDLQWNAETECEMQRIAEHRRLADRAQAARMELQRSAPTELVSELETLQEAKQRMLVGGAVPSADGLLAMRAAVNRYRGVVEHRDNSMQSAVIEAEQRLGELEPKLAKAEAELVRLDAAIEDCESRMLLA